MKSVKVGVNKSSPLKALVLLSSPLEAETGFSWERKRQKKIEFVLNYSIKECYYFPLSTPEVQKQHILTHDNIEKTGGITLRLLSFRTQSFCPGHFVLSYI
jgi:hypothetical protein